MEAGAASAGNAPASAAAGWYANPDGPGARYWSGSEWGQVRAEAVVSPSTSGSVVADQPQVWWVALIAAAAMVIGGFGPWATALGFVSVNGTQGVGWLVITAGVVALLALWSEGRSRQGGHPLVLAAVAGIGGALVAIYTFARLESAQGELLGERIDLVDPAWGLYLAVIASGTLAVAAFRLRRNRDSGAGR
jgi:hypothetical protein